MSLTKSQSSRINGAKSKGPHTAGKLTVLENEDPEIFDSIYNALCEKFQPHDSLERDLLLQAANARFRLRRVWQLETSLFDLEMSDQRKWINEHYRGLSEGERQALAFKSLAGDGRALALAHRYEAGLTRAYERAIAGLLTARKAQKSPQPNEPEQPNEPNDSQSLHTETTQRPLPSRDGNGAVLLQNEPNDPHTGTAQQPQNRDCSSLQRQAALPPVTLNPSTNLHLIHDKKEQQ